MGDTDSAEIRIPPPSKNVAEFFQNSDICPRGTASRPHPIGFEFKPYFVAERKIGNLRDPIVIDSLINGIPLIGRKYAFSLRVGIEALPREYLRYGLEAARKALNDADSQEKEYLKDLAIAALQEVEDELPSGRRESTRKPSLIAKWIDELEETVKGN